MSCFFAWRSEDLGAFSNSRYSQAKDDLYFLILFTFDYFDLDFY